MDLNNLEEIKKLDSMKVAESLSNYPDQIRETWKQAYSADIPKLTPNKVVVSGMGGSSNAAKIIGNLFEKKLKIPFLLYNDYGLPNWVDKDTLVVANTYSGNTEETVSGLEEGIKREAITMGITTGGKVGKLVESKKIHGVIITPTTNPTGFPKSGLGISLGALLGALTKAGVLPLEESELMDALKELDEKRDEWKLESSDNEAKKMAEWFFGSIPVLFGGRPFLGSLQASRNAMDEISRNFSLFFDFPEVNHILVEATLKPDFVKEKLKYLFFDSKFNHERVRIRYGVTKKLFDEQGLSHKTVDVWGSTELAQALIIPHFCAWIAFYIAILSDDDPGPEPWIIKLKDQLGQPTH